MYSVPVHCVFVICLQGTISIEQKLQRERFQLAAGSSLRVGSFNSTFAFDNEFDHGRSTSVVNSSSNTNGEETEMARQQVALSKSAPTLLPSIQQRGSRPRSGTKKKPPKLTKKPVWKVTMHTGSTLSALAAANSAPPAQKWALAQIEVYSDAANDPFETPTPMGMGLLASKTLARYQSHLPMPKKQTRGYPMYRMKVK